MPDMEDIPYRNPRLRPLRVGRFDFVPNLGCALCVVISSFCVCILMRLFLRLGGMSGRLIDVLLYLRQICA